VPRFSDTNFDANRTLVDKIGEIARAKGATPGQIALAWVLAQGDDIVPIPGTKRVAYLEENVGAVSVALSAADREALDRAIPAGAVAGERYAEGGMKTVNL